MIDGICALSATAESQARALLDRIELTAQDEGTDGDGLLQGLAIEEAASVLRDLVNAVIRHELRTDGLAACRHDLLAALDLR